MDMRQLRALVTIADTGSMTKAAEVLHIVQPALSRQLKLLEEELGVILFERNRSGMKLSNEGKILLDYARRALLELERARAELQPTTLSVTGSVALGLLPSLSERLACALMESAALNYPGIKLHFSVGYAGHIQQWLEQGDIDLALLYYPDTSKTIELSPVFHEQLWVAAPPDAGLHVDRAITLADLQSRPLILPAVSHGIRSLVDHLAALNQLKLEIKAETNSLDVQKALVKAGHGWTILPLLAFIDELKQASLCGSPLSDAALQRTIAIAQSALRRQSLAVRCIKELLHQAIQTLHQTENWQGSRWLV